MASATALSWDSRHRKTSPGRVRRDLVEEALATKVAVTIDPAGRKRHVMIGEGFVKRGAADFNHRKAGRAFQHAVADAGRLER